jgi:nitrogen fixation protein
MSDHEVFQFLAYRWDVTEAQKIAARLPVRRFDPQPWFGWLGAIGLDEDHVSTVDLERPVIMVRLREADGAAMLIDGWHRLARAQRESVADLPVVVLDEDQEYQVRIFGGDKQ